MIPSAGGGAPTYEEYAAARNAIDALVLERAAVLPHGLEALRAWLAAGAGERWLSHEAVVTRARDHDLALAMWWEHEWRKARNKAKWDAIKQAKKERTAAPAKVPVSGHAQIAPSVEKSRPAGAQRPTPTPARSFSPTGPVWRP